MWRAKQVRASIARRLETGLDAALGDAVQDIRADLSGPAESPPGGPPGRESGDLAAAVTHEVERRGDVVTARIGILHDPEQAAIGARLAGGFAETDALGRIYTQAPRPWLAPGLRRRAAQIVRRIARGG